MEHVKLRQKFALVLPIRISVDETKFPFTPAHYCSILAQTHYERLARAQAHCFSYAGKKEIRSNTLRARMG